MIKITYQPWKEIVVHEVHEMDVPRFLELVVTQAEAQSQGITPGVSWVDGIAFAFGMFPETPEVLRDKINGRLHYEIVNFTRTSYQPEKKIDIDGRDCIVRLVKGEKNPDFVALAKFLNDFKDEAASETKAKESLVNSTTVTTKKS
jgi:hypothetical protein